MRNKQTNKKCSYDLEGGVMNSHVEVTGYALTGGRQVVQYEPSLGHMGRNGWNQGARGVWAGPT